MYNKETIGIKTEIKNICQEGKITDKIKDEHKN